MFAARPRIFDQIGLDLSERLEKPRKHYYMYSIIIIII